MPARITPWLMGLASTLMGVLRVHDSSIPYRGRLCLILIDTVFETASFVYLRHKCNWKLAQLEALADSRSRGKLFAEVKKVKRVDASTWERMDECHRERNERAHFDPNKDIAERFVRDYFDTALGFINALFGTSLDEAGLRFEAGLHPDMPVGAAGPDAAVPVDVGEALAAATHLYYLDDLTGAMNAASTVAERFDSPHAHYLLALCLKKSGPVHWDQAAEALGRAIQRAPLNSDPRAHLEYADLLLRCNRAADSVQIVRAGFDIGLESIRGREALGLYGDALRATCHFTEALSAYKKGLMHDPTYQRGHEGLVETLLTLELYDEAEEASQAAVVQAPRNSNFQLLLARVRAAQKNYEAAFTILDEAWRISTEKGGRGNNRVLLTRASVLFSQYADLPADSCEAAAALARVKKYVLDALESPAVHTSFRPTFRNFLVGILWREGDLEGAYKQAVQGTRENKFQEKNFVCLAAACLGTGRWEEAKLAATRGQELARQIVVWSLWCELFVLLSRVFVDDASGEVQVLFKKWINRLGAYPEFSGRKFDWWRPRKQLELSAESLPVPARVLVSEALHALDVHPALAGAPSAAGMEGKGPNRSAV